ncbi:MAG: chemoreceptor glutamine deamidase CheD [Gammaproteobacteria bacterium]|jgi:chemotaxis protein CheD|nr:chemoreceptor glutamine deamidase CheD [Gammaproteobacteria bacterium]MBT3722658.1 chemoreceptor glutamine deamidase CheD [Gammaproteobacteria bacterium]MBT4075482.1 chemoreceptor glutamine deamidase CheD [Gammaproteobacteria bacterium]MBT4193022.1 chemoreceptor glutamine deamidase CheD [Gammaproteobacteria bacterium]MBT4451041.1 chemoreceptor glutamine deamidase CheD [Gammaproteobacteria bacterium]
MLKKDQFPRALPGFTQVNRFWDYKNQSVSAKILPGEYYVTTNNEIISTVLGSCVSACVRDIKHGIGAMNHFLLPLHKGEEWSEKLNIDSLATRYGNFAMEHMINDVLKYGGLKKHLEFKVFGGSRVISNMGDVGKSNIHFVLNYLTVEGFKVMAQDVGGINPRKVLYYPQTGKVRVKKIKDLHNDTIIKRESDYMHHIDKEELIDGEIEMFD